MRDQIIKAFEAAGQEPPHADDVNPQGEKLRLQAEEFYNNTSINFSNIKRDTPLDPATVGAKYAWARILETLGVDDAMLVQARVNERDSLIAELRRHDALAMMLKKIGHAAGLYEPEDADRPFSTVEALAAGVALQNIFSRLSDAAVTSMATAAKMREQLKASEGRVDRLTQQVSELQAKLSLAGDVSQRPRRSMTADDDVTNGKYFIIGDMKATDEASDASPIQQRGYLTVMDAESTSLRKYALLPDKSAAVRSFHDVEKAKLLIEKMLQHKSKVRLNPNQLCSLRIVRNVYELWGS